MSFITIIDKTTEPDEGRHRQVSLSIGKDGKMHLLGVLSHNTEIEFPPESIAALCDHYGTNPLIAAAPELLEVCEWLEATMDKDSAIWCAIRDHDGCSEWVKGLRAVIAKATEKGT